MQRNIILVIVVQKKLHLNGKEFRRNGIICCTAFVYFYKFHKAEVIEVKFDLII